MTDLLVQRLKTAKRELTALKTAHKRGLGLLRIYDKEISLEIPAEAAIYNVEIAVQFTSNSSPFPLIEGIPVKTGDSNNISDGGIVYTNNGMVCKLIYQWAPFPPVTETLHLFSTAPILNVTQRWWE